MNSNLRNTIDKVLTDSPSDESDVRLATAGHQHDFPYDREEEAQVTRREFCNFLGVTSAALFAGAAGFAGKAALDARQSETFISVKIDGAEGMAPGTSLNFRYPSEKDSAILVRSLDGSYHAFGQRCTHLACPVYFDLGHQRLECPCHEGAFNATTGDVLYGPPPRPLDVVSVEVRGNEVWATGRQPGLSERAV